MPLIYLETAIDAPEERVFDLARSIDAHQDTAAASGERAIGGVTSGLLGPNQEVTWRARHFGIVQRLRVKMTAFDRPRHFQDVMLEGAFKHMTHNHRFEPRGAGTLMIDRFDFAAPLGVLGRFAEHLFLTRYMRTFLVERNAILKQLAESEQWKRYL
jgi:ligand-binding SRPBCC domain-containing protein